MDISAVNTMVTNLGAPCLVFSSLARLSVSSAALADMALATALAVAVFLAVGAVILRLARLSLPVYLPSLAFTNCGNMGLPLSLFAFGQMGLDLAAAYFAVSMVVMMVLGLWLVSGEPTPKKALTMPLPYAVAAALAFRAAEVEVPAWLYNSTDLLGGMTVPLMLLTLGVSLASMRVVEVRRALALAVLRLAMGAAVGVAVAALFDFDGVARGVLIIQCAMPPAVFNYLFAQNYDRKPEETASVILISTLISFLTLPLLLPFVLP
jgi:predicted permease